MAPVSYTHLDVYKRQGLGPAAGAAFDGMDISAKVGTVAGDDTVLIVMRENESAAELCSEIEDMQRQRQTK